MSGGIAKLIGPNLFEMNGCFEPRLVTVAFKIFGGTGFEKWL
jgi:hypothetical protein